MSTPYDCVIGLGSNEGDRRQILSRALDELAARACIRAVSSLYETEPIGGPSQAEYLNAAARLDWPRPLEALLSELIDIETRFARHRSARWAPRTLDLDILWVDGTHREDPDLTVPHPRLRERAFALVPLLEVAPQASDPVTGVRYSSIEMPSGRIRRVARPDWKAIR